MELSKNIGIMSNNDFINFAKQHTFNETFQFIKELEKYKFHVSALSHNGFRAIIFTRWGSGVKQIYFKGDVFLTFRESLGVIHREGITQYVERFIDKYISKTYGNNVINKQIIMEKKTIKLNESQLRKMIREAIDRTIGNKVGNYGTVAGEEHDGFIRVQRDRGDFIFIRPNGKPLSSRYSLLPISFIDARDFSNGYAVVKVSDGWTIIGTDGYAVIDDAYDQISDVDASGKAQAVRDGKQYIISVDGEEMEVNGGEETTVDNDNAEASVDTAPGAEPMSNQQPEAMPVPDKKTPVVMDSKQLTQELFRKISSGEKLTGGMFKSGWARVKLNNMYNFVNNKKEIMSPNLWFKNADEFDDNFKNFVVVIPDKCKEINWGTKMYVLGKDGTLYASAKRNPSALNLDYPQDKKTYMKGISPIGNLKTDSLEQIAQNRSGERGDGNTPMNENHIPMTRLTQMIEESIIRYLKK